MRDELTGLDFDKLISYEVVGKWPIYKKTLRELLKDLGAVEENNNFVGFDTNDPILDLYPVRLRDDGMGYGIDREFFTEVSCDNKSYLYFFTEKQLSEDKLKQYISEQQQMAKEIIDWYESRQLETNKG